MPKTTTAKVRSKRSTAIWATILAVILLGLAIWAIIVATQPNTNYRDMDTYIGLTETEAIERAEDGGLEHRVVERDGEMYPITQDLNYDRVNFTIMDEQVSKAEIY